jgi:hypothetical protein
MLRRMKDRRDPHYTPFGKRQAPRPRDPADVIRTLRREGVEWTGELVFRGESYGWESRVLRDRELFNSRRFIQRAPAVDWANELLKNVKRGWQTSGPLNSR